MRFFALFLLAILCYVKLAAQMVSGFVGDAKGKSVPGATIALKTRADSVIIKLNISDTNGRYAFSSIPAGLYFITVSDVGYLPANSAAFEVKDNRTVTVAPISLTIVTHELQQAQVTTTKPLVEVKPDRIVLNIENSINSIGEDVLDLLRKAPGVTVDNSNTLGINGKNGVQVYVDGRPTYLSGNDLANYLKTIQSSSIESIEIITNPPVKYEAAGSAGIINIRLKKDKFLGTNVTAGAGYSIGTYSKYDANIAFNHRDNNLNVFGGYTYHNASNLNYSNQYRTLLDTLFLQHTDLVEKSVSHAIKTGLDYFLDKRNTLGILVNANFSTDSSLSNSATPIIYIPTNTTNRLLEADNRTSELHDNYNVNLNYHYTDSSGHDLVANADYGLYRIRSNQLQPNNYYDSTGKTFLYSNDYNILSPTNIYIYSIKLDYQANFLKGQVGVGAKVSYVTTQNNFQEYDVLHSVNVLDSLSSDNFNYKENINAAYVNYSRSGKGWNVQGGLRVENTNSKGISTGWQQASADYSPYDSTYPRHYTNFFPNASFTWNETPADQWTLSYGRRIDRPNYADLNPFEVKLDDYTFSKGNTQLRPQYADNLQLSYSYKNNPTITLNYSHVNNLFTTIPDTTDRSKTIVTSVNLANQYIAGLTVTYLLTYKWYSLFANVNGHYALYKSNFGGPGRIVDLNIFNTTVYTQHVFRLGSGWTANITGVYLGPNILTATLIGRHMSSLDAGLQKTLFNGNATIKASVSDIFHAMPYSYSSNFAGQYLVASGDYESRQLKLYFTYRFGNKQVKAASQHVMGAEDENKRVNVSTP
jgi:outer membrane receptor protein involved in Fe transport